MQPGTGVIPPPIGGCDRDAENLRRLFDSHAREITELYQFSLFWLARREALKCLIQRQKRLAPFRRCGLIDVEQIEPFAVAAALETPFATRIFDENPPHRLAGRRKKMPPVFEPLLPD